VASLLGSALLAAFVAVALGSLLGRLGLGWALIRSLLDILTQFRASLGFWLLGVVSAREGWLAPALAIGCSAGAMQAVPIARWICRGRKHGELSTARAVALGQSSARLVAASTRARGAALGAVVSTVVHVAILTAAWPGLAPEASPLSNPGILPSLALLPLLLFIEPISRRLLSRVTA
jgi:hypothetical protein